MLKRIQAINFFLWTAFGDMTDFAGLMFDIKTQGLCQGNGAALVGCTVVSITILNAHQQKGHGAKLICPLLQSHSNLAAVLCVDDADIIHLDTSKFEDAEADLAGLQRSVTNWGQ
jgi:hypothetical protein